MMGVDSPASLQSTESGRLTHTPKQPSRSHGGPSYRLFPSVEPTPPASPVNVHKRIGSRTAESSRRRSSSADDSARAAAERHVPVKQVSVRRGRKESGTEVKPMSTVQESADSPILPANFPRPPFISDDCSHSRSSSAPGDYMPRKGSLPPGVLGPQPRTVWANGSARSSPQAPKGLGLTLPSSQFAPREPRRVGPSKSKPKPNLRIRVDNDDRPPPPPPKSPRHSRDPSAASAQSGVSSMHGESPDSATVVTPGSIDGATLLDTRGQPIPTPLPQRAEQGSYFPSGGQFRPREISITKDRSRQTEPSPPKPQAQSAENPIPTKITVLDVDKPMPSLPGSFSAHIREVREAEESEFGLEKDVTPSIEVQSSAATDTPSHARKCSRRAEQKSKDSNNQPASSLLNSQAKLPARDARSPTPDLAGRTPQTKSTVRDIRSQTPDLASRPKQTKPPIRNTRSPTPDIGSRPESPANILQTVSSAAKTLPVLPSEGPPVSSRAATPDFGNTLFKGSEPKSLKTDPDPLQTLQNLSKQCEALHARYASLRADRVKISTSISASLKDEKPGSDYANILLDQHLSLNAINSSMDICFAKLKSLDCRKEEAMASFVRQMKTNSVDSSLTSGSVLSKSPLLATSSQLETGRATPEVGMEPKSLSPELIPTSKFAKGGMTPEPAHEAKDGQSKDVVKAEKQDSPEPEKRITIIRASEAPDTPSELPVSPLSASSIHNLYATRRIRIKGAKAAKILGLVALSADGSPNGAGITLPDDTPPMPSLKDIKKPFALEVEIQSRKSQNQKERPLATRTASSPVIPPGQNPNMPKRKPPPPPKHDAQDSVSSQTSSQTESLPEESEVKTPRGSEESSMPFGLKAARRDMLQTIQVFVDDDILDYYKSGGLEASLH